MGKNLDDCAYGDAILDTIPKTWSVEEIINKLDFIKSKDFFSEKNNVKIMRRQAADWDKYLQKTHLIKDCYTKYTKNSYNSTIGK